MHELLTGSFAFNESKGMTHFGRSNQERPAALTSFGPQADYWTLPLVRCFIWPGYGRNQLID
jgi:hypothetical protein